MKIIQQPIMSTLTVSKFKKSQTAWSSLGHHPFDLMHPFVYFYVPIVIAILQANF